MGSQSNRDTIRAYMREHHVNYTTAKRALTAPTAPAAREWDSSPLMPLGHTPDGAPVGIDTSNHPHTLVTGMPGSGKTHLMSQIIRAAVEQGEPVVVVAEKPTDYDWVPDTVRRTNSDVDPGSASALREVRDLLYDVVGKPYDGGPSRMWVVVDGLTKFMPRHAPTGGESLDEAVRQEIAQAIEHIGALGRSLRVHLVLTASRGTENASTLCANQVLLRHNVNAEASLSSDLRNATTARRAENLERGEALLFTPYHDGTKIATRPMAPAPSALPDMLPFPEEGTPDCARWHEAFRQGRVLIGQYQSGEDVVLDLDREPHALVSGHAGGGKTSLLHLIAYGALSNPDVVDLIVAETKTADLRWLAACPNVRRYAVKDVRTLHEEIHAVTESAVEAMNSRQSLLREHGVENLSELRRGIQNGTITGITLDEVPKRLIFVFDEGGAAFTPTKDPDLKEMQDTARTNMENLGMLARAMEVNIVMAAQKPSEKNIGTAMRAQMGNRIWYGNRISVKDVIEVLEMGGDEAPPIADALHDTPKGRGYLNSGTSRGLFQSLFIPKSRLFAAAGRE